LLAERREVFAAQCRSMLETIIEGRRIASEAAAYRFIADLAMGEPSDD
jgi:hypothetical protein